MMPKTGIDVLVKVNTGTDDMPVWTTVAGQRGLSRGFSVDTIDVTSKDTVGWREFIAGFSSWTIDFDGLYVEDDAGYQALMDAVLSKKPVKVRMIDSKGKGLEGLAIITDFPLEAPYDAEMTYSVSLQGTGPLTEVV